MSGFDPVLLPSQWARSVRRETHFRTDIVTTGSGAEHRNAGWARARRHYVLDAGPLPLAEIRELEQFFSARRGRHRGFLLSDWMQPHSGTGATPMPDDVVLSPLDAKRRQFRVALPTYENAHVAAEGLLLALDGSLLTAATDYVFDARRGLVRLSKAIAASQKLTAGFYLHIPVRFDADRLDIERVSTEMARIAPLPLSEILAPQEMA